MAHTLRNGGNPSPIRRVASAVFVGLLAASVAVAAPIQAGGGFDYYSGPNHQITRSALATVGVGLGPAGSGSVAAIRYDDTVVGRGNAYLAGLGLPLGPLTSLRVWGTRYIGDESFRAWRVKTGPQLALPGGRTLGLYYMHYTDNADGKSDGASGELNVPLVAGLSTRASASYATALGDQRSTQGSVGLSWAPVHGLELSGEMGLARGGAASEFVPSRGPLDRLLGGPPSKSSNQAPSTDPVALVGVRVTFP